MTEQQLIAKIGALAAEVGPDDWIMWHRGLMIGTGDENMDGCGWFKHYNPQDALWDLLKAFDAYKKEKTSWFRKFKCLLKFLFFTSITGPTGKVHSRSLT